jgi:hypothetical protein
VIVRKALDSGENAKIQRSIAGGCTRFGDKRVPPVLAAVISTWR